MLLKCRVPYFSSQAALNDTIISLLYSDGGFIAASEVHE